jgi:hypothetical protein
MGPEATWSCELGGRNGTDATHLTAIFSGDFYAELRRTCQTRGAWVSLRDLRRHEESRVPRGSLMTEKGWHEEIAEIRRRQALAAEMGGTDRVERQRSRGKLTVRERIAVLLDPDSFRE